MSERSEEPSKIATIEEFFAASKVIKVIEYDGMKMRIRPLTWREEFSIAQTVGEYIKQGMPEEVANRQYFKLAVLVGLVDPKLTEVQVEGLKWGMVKYISDEIGNITKKDQKKE